MRLVYLLQLLTFLLLLPVVSGELPEIWYPSVQCYDKFVATLLSNEKPKISTQHTAIANADPRLGRPGAPGFNIRGKPLCVIMRGVNNSHHVLMQAATYSSSLPMQCHINVQDTFTYTENGTSFTGYCSSRNMSNGDDSVLYMYNPYTDGWSIGLVFVSLLRTSSKFAVHITCNSIIVCILSVIHFYYEKYQQSRKKNTATDRTKEHTNIIAEDAVESDSAKMNVDDTQKTTKRSQKLESRKKVTKVSNVSVLDTKTPHAATPLLLALTPVARTPSLPTAELQATEKKAKKDKKDKSDSESPTQPSATPSRPSGRPKPRLLENGRIQRVSMNYSNSTYSDLE